MDTKHLKIRCYSCRQLRAKCDGNVPECGRCQKSGTTCPGYPDRLFRSMNDIAKLRVAKSNNSRSQTRGTTELASSQAHIYPTGGSFAFSIPQSMTNNQAEIAISYFFEKKVTASYFNNEYLIADYLDFLPDVYSVHAENTFLKEALSACSLYILSKQPGMHGLAFEARSSYVRALCSARNLLGDEVEMKNDPNLTALFLLSIIEVIDGDELSAMRAHIKAQDWLLRLGGPVHRRNKAGVSLYRINSCREQISSLMFDTILQAHSVAELNAICPCKLDADTYVFLYRISTICNAVRQYAQRESADIDITRGAHLLPAMKQAMSLNEDIIRWNDHAKNHLEYGFKSSSLSVDGNIESLFPNVMLTFKNTYYAGIWIRAWAGRITLLQMLYGCMEAYDFAEDLSDYLSVSAIRRSLYDLLHNFCAAISFSNNNDDGNPVSAVYNTMRKPLCAAMVLTFASSIKFLDEVQSNWINERLLQARKIKLVEKALVTNC